MISLERSLLLISFVSDRNIYFIEILSKGHVENVPSFTYIDAARVKVICEQGHLSP